MISKSKHLAIRCIALLTLISGFAISAEPTSKEDLLLVEISIFSGRPNPKFLITDPLIIREIMEFAGDVLPKHPTLKDDDENAAPSGGLGYSGFLIENVSSLAPEVESIWVYRANVLLHKRSTKNPTGKLTNDFRIDADVKLEQRLIRFLKEKKIVKETLIREITGN